MVVLDNVGNTGPIPKDVGTGWLLPSGPARQPDHLVLYERERARADATEVRARAGNLKRIPDRCHENLQADGEEVRTVRHTAKDSLFLQSEGQRLKRLLADAGVDSSRWILGVPHREPAANFSSTGFRMLDRNRHRQEFGACGPLPQPQRIAAVVPVRQHQHSGARFRQQPLHLLRLAFRQGIRMPGKGLPTSTMVVTRSYGKASSPRDPPGKPMVSRLTASSGRFRVEPSSATSRRPRYQASRESGSSGAASPNGRGPGRWRTCPKLQGLPRRGQTQSVIRSTSPRCHGDGNA